VPTNGAIVQSIVHGFCTFAQCSAVVSLQYLRLCAAGRDHCAADSLCAHCFFGRKILAGNHFQLFFSVSRSWPSQTAPKDGRFHCSYMRLRLSPLRNLFWWDTKMVPNTRLTSRNGYGSFRNSGNRATVRLSAWYTKPPGASRDRRGMARCLSHRVLLFNEIRAASPLNFPPLNFPSMAPPALPKTVMHLSAGLPIFHTRQKIGCFTAIEKVCELLGCRPF